MKNYFESHVEEIAEDLFDELDGAKKYAEKYDALKKTGDVDANKFKEMSYDELKHASYMHEFAIKEHKKLEQALQKYDEHVMTIKQMLM